MKTTLILLASLVSTQAFAAASLTQVHTNGTVAPFYQVTTTCQIEGRLVSTSSRGRSIDFPVTLQKQAKFTPAVPNETVMESLIQDVFYIIPIVPAPSPFPAGGAVTTYTANLNQQTKTLKIVSGNRTLQANPTDAAKALAAFMALNCNH